MNKIKENQNKIWGYFIGDIYKKSYDITKHPDLLRSNSNNSEKNIIRNQLFSIGFDNLNISGNYSALFPSGPWRICEDDNCKRDSYYIDSELSAKNEEGDRIYFKYYAYNTILKFLNPNVVNEIFRPTGGNIYEAASQLLACQSILLLASKIMPKESCNPMIAENKNAIRQYIQLFDENPDTIQRIFEYSDYDRIKYPGVTQALCNRVEAETYKLEKNLKK